MTCKAERLFRRERQHAGFKRAAGLGSRGPSELIRTILDLSANLHLNSDAVDGPIGRVQDSTGGLGCHVHH